MRGKGKKKTVALPVDQARAEAVRGAGGGVPGSPNLAVGGVPGGPSIAGGGVPGLPSIAGGGVPGRPIDRFGAGGIPG
jgi:hypothetical protein